MKSLNVNKKRALRKHIENIYDKELTFQFSVIDNNLYLLSSDNRGINLSKALSPQGGLTPVNWTGGKGKDIEIDDPSLNTQGLVNDKTSSNVDETPKSESNINPVDIAARIASPPLAAASSVYKLVNNLFRSKPETPVPVLEASPGPTRRLPTAEEQANRGNVN